ncbi:GPI ethanolamine phosphate transferase 2 isoform X1 [Iris pallida]|uniref:GPI ethanolamine phosphate transferase 2 isoform X1 n=1 Tax=Iris pallida TaxID=29817 RepID=A0AAX6FHV9_IRIPA|nr:GPI ethanolamine phosphate transferase 2 isoform X1 [Iris pallida]
MASPISCAKLTAWTFAAVLLQILGLSLFIVGFFPTKPTLPGKSGLESYRMPTCGSATDAEVEMPPEQLSSSYKEHSKILPAYDQLILMVVDGLPAEFILGRGDKPPPKSLMEAMPYTQTLLSDGKAIAYHARAAPPTVTMPRLKAMVSGAIGGFLDVAFNFNTKAFLDDNLLDQFYRIGWKMVMFGDNTWSKLFPGLFTREDGVSSFYVKDTVEVDLNVSRHLEIELAANDWNLLILHYLGLDHVGHIGGRRSALMVPKLKEMDDVIMMIHMNRILHQDKSQGRTLLVVVSDHGMTDGGNHGGSSYEETDSLALFIGGDTATSHFSAKAHNSAFQVDITPTLALLLGVPIPKNNVGVVIFELLSSLTDKEKLRALELNSWQLLRLLQAHLPGLICGGMSCHGSQVSGYMIEEKLCHSFSKATAARNLWELQLRNSSFMVDNTDEFHVVVTLQYEFLRNASQWLSHRATDKPITLLLSGVVFMVISCTLLFNLLFFLFKEVYSTQKQFQSQPKERDGVWNLDEAFVLLGILIHVLSLGASSMVEEEQYTWHFLVSTLYLIFLFLAVHSLLKRQRSGPADFMGGNEYQSLHKEQITSSCTNGRFSVYGGPWLKISKDYYQVTAVLVVLICGRILRGWHQGGVNWVHLPDISKWLEQTGTSSIKSFQIASLLLLGILYFCAFRLVKLKSYLIYLVLFSNFISGSLIILHILETQSHTVLLMNYSSTVIARILYLSVIVTVVLTSLSSPWILPIHHQRTHMTFKPNMSSHSINKPTNSLLLAIQDSTYLNGMTYVSSWCLLQLLLQQPINAMPILLILLQLSASIIYFSADGSRHRQWVEVAALHFLGMVGHFGLGNSNSLATLDVAGAFIGISSHSTVLSGILMFIITYASPLLSFLCMIMSISTKDMRYYPTPAKRKFGCMLRTMIAFPCLLPLVLNSIILNAFTIILLLMRNHLFVWSVFSPKYLYICAATVSVYIGVFIIAATGVYVSTVLSFRTNMFKSYTTSS